MIQPVQCLLLVPGHLANPEILADRLCLANPSVPEVLANLETQLDPVDQVVQ